MNKFEAYKLKPGDRVSIGGSPDLIVESLKLLPGDRFELRTVNVTNPDDVAVFTEGSIYAVEKLETQAPVVAVVENSPVIQPAPVETPVERAESKPKAKPEARSKPKARK